MGLFLRLLICISFAGLLMYKWVDKLNEVTELRMSIPIVEKEVREIAEKNLELRFAIDQFENPAHLIEIARRPEYGHLKYPLDHEVILLPEYPLDDVEGG